MSIPDASIIRACDSSLTAEIEDLLTLLWLPFREIA